MSHISASLQAAGVVSGVSPDPGSSWQSAEFTDHFAPIFITEVGKECLLWPCEVTTCLPGMSDRLVTLPPTHCPWRMKLSPTTFPDPCDSPCIIEVLEMVGTEP